MREWIRVIVGALVLLCVGCLWGCSFLTPGLDTRVAAEARSETIWDAEDNLTLSEATTHNREVIAAEGDNVTVTMVDGQATNISGGTHILWQKSEPKDVMSAYIALAQKNAEVAERMFGAIERLTGLLAPAVGNSGGGEANNGGGELRDKLMDEILRRLPDGATTEEGEDDP